MEECKRVQFGSGSQRHRIPGWYNHDHDVDVRKPIPFVDKSINFITAEHLIEHINQHEAYRFLCECHRILKPGGIVRIVFPDVKRILDNCDDAYLAFVKKHHNIPATTKTAIEQIIFNFRHQSFWTVDLMETTMQIAGFYARVAEYNKSMEPELNGIDSHWKSIGWDAAFMESSVVEGIK